MGILWDADERFAAPLLDGLGAEAGLVVGDNEPYDGALAGDTVDRHATVRGLATALIEIRQDLIAERGRRAGMGGAVRPAAEALRADPAECAKADDLSRTRTRERLRRTGGSSP